MDRLFCCCAGASACWSYGWFMEGVGHSVGAARRWSDASTYFGLSAVLRGLGFEAWELGPIGL